MYFTTLPDHTEPGFDEALHFSRFKKNNIIFNAAGSGSNCDDHVGCLSFKTVLSGEEWYGINNHRVALRPGRFLVLNDDQPYSCYSNKGEDLRILSVFFKKEFAAAVFYDALHTEQRSLEAPFATGKKLPEFFQTLHTVSPGLQQQLSGLITALNNQGYNAAMTDERLSFILRHLIQTLGEDTNRLKNVDALKPATKTEIYKRVCIAKDILHSSYTDNLDLDALSKSACLSVPQLVRQFKTVFNTTPYQYLIRVRLKNAADILQNTRKPVHEIAWQCGFENTSAFCRAFKSAYGEQPINFRNRHS